MSLADNLKNIRKERSLKQIKVATHIGVDKSAYSKIEKGSRAVTVEELQKLAGIFNITIDQILNNNGKIPSEVVIEIANNLQACDTLPILQPALAAYFTLNLLNLRGHDFTAFGAT